MKDIDLTILELLERLTTICRNFAENVNRELNALGGSLGIAYDIEFELIKKEVSKVYDLTLTTKRRGY
jgi:hypothetical protein